MILRHKIEKDKNDSPFYAAEFNMNEHLQEIRKLCNQSWIKICP